MNEKGRDSKGALRFLAARLKKHLPLLALISLLMAAVSVLSVSMSLFMANAIDAAVSGDTKRMFVKLGIMAGVTLLGLALRFAVRLLQARMEYRMEMSLRRSLLCRILDRDYEKVSAYHSGDLLNRLTNDTGVVASAAASMLPRLCELAARLGFAFGVLAYFDWMFAVIALAAAVVIAAFSLIFRPLIKRLHRRVQETEGDTRAFMQETIENQLVVRVFGVRERMIGRADEFQETNFKAAVKRKVVGLLSGEGMNFVFTLGVIAALCWGTLSIAGVFGPDKVISYGTLAAVLQLVSQVQSPFAALAGLVPQFFAMTASCERLMEIEKLDPETKGLPEDGPKEFVSATIEDLSFSYRRGDKGVDVFEGASAEIRRGEFVAVTGVSGIGKSTLMKLLLGVYRPNGGGITIVSERGREKASAATRGLFAYVPQGNLLLSGTVRENIAFFNAKATDGEIMRAAEIACADGFINALPQGLDTVIGEHGAGLSEGQAQRLAVARAVILGAPVLLLDEATSALDGETEARLLGNLRQSGVETVVIITHRQAALSVCDKELRFENGSIETVIR
ncbi:MAG: ABC transporter ATP-binding protein/permease [Clostridiales bacterium]|nr:ABC transporter ATP-binding protein/permease [Clostridiales bacterium]